MKYCWFCGKQNTDTSKYCYNCGKQLDPEEEKKTVTVQPPVQETAESREEAVIGYCQTIPKPQKYVPTLTDKEATASLVLSVIGVLLFWGLPIQILALILGIKGKRSEKRRTVASVGIGLALFGIACFTALLIFIIFNFEAIINSDLFTEIYYALF